MISAQQCFESDHLTVHRELGLVVQFELVVSNGNFQVRQQGEVRVGVGFHRMIETNQRSLPRLRDVERHVGAAHDHREIGIIVMQLCPTDVDTCVDGLADDL